MKQGLVRLLCNFCKRFMGWTLRMIMCVLLCYPVSIHMLQLLSTGRPISSCRKVQMETPSESILLLFQGYGCPQWTSQTPIFIPHPSSIKEISSVHPYISNFSNSSLFPVLATTPQVFKMIEKELWLMALSRGVRLVRAQSQEVQPNTGRCEPNPVLRVGHQLRKIRTKTHLDSGFNRCKTHSKHSTSRFDPINSQVCLDCRMYDIPNWVCFHIPFQWHFEKNYRYPDTGHCPSLVRDHIGSPGLVAESCPTC